MSPNEVQFRCCDCDATCSVSQSVGSAYYCHSDNILHSMHNMVGVQFLVCIFFTFPKVETSNI